MNPSQKILETAQSFIGRDASPDDLAPDELGCAETVSDILFDAGCDIPSIVSTQILCYFLETSKSWTEVATPLGGDVIISPTGSSPSKIITHGHTGIVLGDGVIGSNDSATGEFLTHWTIDMWRAHWGAEQYPVRFFRFIGSLTPETAPTEEEKVAVVSEGLDVAEQAAQYPSLKASVLAFLSSLISFLKLK